MASDSIPYSRKGERKISPFVGHELLYDYVTSHLDVDRANAVGDFVKNSRDAQHDIQKIHDGLKYIEQLSKIQVSTSLLDTLKTPSSYIQVLLRKLRFDDWSPGIKMGLEVMIVAVGVISITLVLPWHKLMDVTWSGRKEIILTEVQKASMASQDVEVSGSPEENTVVFPDDSDKTKVKPVEKVVAVVPPAAAPVPTPMAKPPTATVAAVVTPAPEKPKEIAKATKDEATAEKRQGYLFRGLIRVTNAKAVSPKFVEKITELGGRKAGAVELGWEKENSAYFHFTIPEAKYQELIDFSKTYGGLSLQKEKHDRVMPEGIIRIIFSIEEKK